jgi:membrane protein implicated in regulation of membrane protease activity
MAYPVRMVGKCADRWRHNGKIDYYAFYVNAGLKHGLKTTAGRADMMNDWMIWLALAGGLVILELISGTFYLLMIALGMLAGSLAAVLYLNSSWQMIVAGTVGVVATLLLHNSKYGWKKNAVATRDPNVNLDIGQSLSVNQWKPHGEGKFVARTMYRGAQWDVELHNATAEAGVFVIKEVRGSNLIVAPSK